MEELRAVDADVEVIGPAVPVPRVNRIKIKPNRVRLSRHEICHRQRLWNVAEPARKPREWGCLAAVHDGCGPFRSDAAFKVGEVRYRRRAPRQTGAAFAAIISVADGLDFRPRQ